MPDDERYSLTELADLAGVTPRTVRYYLAQGLLPAVGQTGPGSKYGAGTSPGCGSSAGSRRSTCRSPRSGAGSTASTTAEIRELAGRSEPAPPTDSALDYLRTVLGRPAVTGRRRPPRPRPRRAAAIDSGSRRQRPRCAETLPSDADAPSHAVGAAAAATAPADARRPPPVERSQWERIALAPDVELHIRRPLARAQQKAGRPPRDDRP